MKAGMMKYPLVLVSAVFFWMPVIYVLLLGYPYSGPFLFTAVPTAICAVWNRRYPVYPFGEIHRNNPAILCYPSLPGPSRSLRTGCYHCYHREGGDPGQRAGYCMDRLGSWNPAPCSVFPCCILGNAGSTANQVCRLCNHRDHMRTCCNCPGLID